MFGIQIIALFCRLTSRCSSSDASGGAGLRASTTLVPEHWTLCISIGRPKSETNGGSIGGERVGPGKRTHIITTAKISLGVFGSQGCVFFRLQLPATSIPFPSSMPKNGGPVQQGIGNAKRRAAGSAGTPSKQGPLRSRPVASGRSVSRP